MKTKFIDFIIESYRVDDNGKNIVYSDGDYEVIKIK